jgi:ammonium transporter, Amt family
MSSLDPAELATKLEETRVSMNLMWTLIAAFLVMFMQAGFAMVESGLTRAKNVAHTMGMNFIVYAIGVIGFWAIGFGLQMGGVGDVAVLGGTAELSGEFTVNILGHDFGLFGMKGFFLSPAFVTPGIATLFIFQMVFMDTTCTIPTGAMAERWRFSAFVIFSFVMATIIYPVYANWVWGGGFLSTLGKNFGLGHGHVDFAGCSVVHLTGGVAAFIGAKLIGPRHGKFGPNGEPRAIVGHNIGLAVVGTFVLAFGWFGFNAGSTLAGTDTRIAVVALNTMLASAAGALSATAFVWRRFGKPDPTWMCNGMLAGLVAITASCAFVSPIMSVFIGTVAGLLVVVAATFIEEKLKIDDPVGAIAVHGVNGAFGALCVGLFSNGTYGDGFNGVPGAVRGAFFGDVGQLWASLIGISANIIYVGLVSFAAFKVIDLLVGQRVSPDDELYGLDVPEMGMEGYAPESVNETLPHAAE